MPSDVIRPTAFNPGPSLARVAAAPGGWTIDCRGPRAAQAHSFTCEGCAAEFARALRDEGGWSLRSGPGCQGVERAIADLDERAVVLRHLGVVAEDGPDVAGGVMATAGKGLKITIKSVPTMRPTS